MFDALLILAGILLVILKAAGVAFLATVSWWLVCLPFIVFGVLLIARLLIFGSFVKKFHDHF